MAETPHKATAASGASRALSKEVGLAAPEPSLAAHPALQHQQQRTELPIEQPPAYQESPRSDAEKAKAIQVPDWETGDGRSKRQSILPTWGERSMRRHSRRGGGPKLALGVPVVVRDKWDKLAPPGRKYCGLKRRVFFSILAALILIMLILVIVLPVVLLRKHAQSLPLPQNGQVVSGDLTYYNGDGGLGACGSTIVDTDDHVSISHVRFDAESTGSDPNANPLCGKTVRASRLDDAVGEQRSVDLKVVDRCVGCAANDIDVSPAAFKKLADISEGRVECQWTFLD